MLVADAVQQHDLPLLATIAERIEHAHERRQSRAGSDEQGSAPIVLQQEAAFGALDVDRVAHLALPEQVGERAALDEADEELVFGEVVGGGRDRHRPLDQLALRTHETQGRVLARLESERRVEAFDAHDDQAGCNFLPPAEAAVVRIGVAHERVSAADTRTRRAVTRRKYRGEARKSSPGTLRCSRHRPGID